MTRIWLLFMLSLIGILMVLMGYTETRNAKGWCGGLAGLALSLAGGLMAILAVSQFN